MSREREPAEKLSREMRVMFDAEEMEGFFAGFDPLEVLTLFDDDGQVR